MKEILLNFEANIQDVLANIQPKKVWIQNKEQPILSSVQFKFKGYTVCLMQIEHSEKFSELHLPTDCTVKIIQGDCILGLGLVPEKQVDLNLKKGNFYHIDKEYSQSIKTQGVPVYFILIRKSMLALGSKVRNLTKDESDDIIKKVKNYYKI